MNSSYWNGVRAFLAVAGHGSFTAASEASGVSKASLSQHISALEKNLGVQLLHRTTRSLRLTDVGLGFQRLCQQGVDQLESAQAWAVQANQALQGPIRMNAVGGLIGEELITPLVIEFLQQHPKVNVELDFSSHRVDLLKDPVDLVMRMGDLPDSSLVARRLYRIRTRYVASPGFVAERGEIEHPEQLRELPLICGSVTEWLFVRQQERVTLPIKQSFKVANGRAMLQAAKAGLGVARLADVYVQPGLDDGSLVEVLPDWNHATELSLVCPPARYQVQRVKALMDWLVANFESRYQALLG
ncbi:LysR family transcriptional regulator [Motiliproteus sp.]|uniref:LysR family transcriptional regulator n=1 Tax=Motiliproteus sp. TaxID=1898955 RepID=UPI003BA9A77E